MYRSISLLTRNLPSLKVPSRSSCLRMKFVACRCGFTTAPILLPRLHVRVFFIATRSLFQLFSSIALHESRYNYNLVETISGIECLSTGSGGRRAKKKKRIGVLQRGRGRAFLLFAWPVGVWLRADIILDRAGREGGLPLWSKSSLRKTSRCFECLRFGTHRSSLQNFIVPGDSHGYRKMTSFRFHAGGLLEPSREILTMRNSRSTLQPLTCFS